MKLTAKAYAEARAAEGKGVRVEPVAYVLIRKRGEG
jgi:hypothetical protein